MKLNDLLFGRPLRSSEEAGEKLGPVGGLSVFGLDALSSAAYGPEAALTLLIPLAAAGIAYLVPITASIIILLAIVYFSYRQTIEAYPSGGGSYTVARENLGEFSGLLAAAALMIDYVLTAAVGISAGVGALVSAVPSLQPHTLSICLVILLLITMVNLRGVRETGAVFIIPTYVFVGSLLATLILGVAKTLVAGGHPMPIVAPPPLPLPTAAVGAWILLKAFSSGCTAMTGVEAVSNGVKAFREPVAKTAQRALTMIIAILIVLLGGVAFLVRAYHIGATGPGQAGYQSVLSMLVAAVAGQGVFYYITMCSILLVLALSANTAFADLPRLCRAVAEDGYLPQGFASRGRRLVFTQGIWLLAVLCALLLTLFGGVTDRLIPLYAVGAFLAFTMSQAGMVAHWRRTRGKGWRRSIFVNGLGAVATAITVIVVTVAKFIDGAWVTALLIPAIMLVMVAIKTHYRSVQAEIADPAPLDVTGLQAPLVVVPILSWNKVAQKGLRFALTLSSDVHILHIDCEKDDGSFCQTWDRLIEEPAIRVGRVPPRLIELPSPYRFVITPILDYILELDRANPDRQIAVLIPELVERHWYHYFLHNQRAEVLRALLLAKGSQRIVLINVPWHITA
ncbi:Amino acid permease-associated region [Acidobacteriia bacterium SbA2]|nr:Amino acid permease-associated region [Acidobacteriia bacterium SbA2]